MALKVNLAQINNAAGGNSNLRETLTGIHLALQSLYAQTGSSPLNKVDASTTAFTAPPSPSKMVVTGANGSFSVSVTPTRNATNAAVYQEISSSPVANFASGVVTYPISTNTSYVFPNPSATLYFRLRSSYNQQNWSSYQALPGAVSAGLQSSAATQPNISLNQSNFATVDSVAAGGSATVRVYGSGGVGTNWTSILGSNSKVIPGGTILNVSYGANGYVAWDGSQYQFKPGLTQTFPDGWIPVGKVSVIANGAGLSLPTIHAVISSGAIIAYNVTNGGNGITGPLSFAITDTGAGTGATVGAATVANGVLQSLAPGNPGANYTGTITVTPSGGISAGVGGGGGANGLNSGRFYSDGTNS